MTDRNDTDGDRTLAAEYALGLLSSQEAAAFETLLDQNAAARADYAQWAHDFATLADDIDPVLVPDAVLIKIHQVIETIEPSQAFTKPQETATSNPQGRSAASAIQGLLQKLGLLPAMGAGLAAAIAVLWLINISGVMTPAVSLPTAMLASADDSLRVQITYSEDGTSLNIHRTAGTAPEG